MKNRKKVALSVAMAAGLAGVVLAAPAVAVPPGQANGQQWSTGVAGAFALSPAVNTAYVWTFGDAALTATETVTAQTGNCGITNQTGQPGGANAASYIAPGWSSDAKGAETNCLAGGELKTTTHFSKPVVGPILHVMNLDGSTLTLSGDSTTSDPLSLSKIAGNDFAGPGGTVLNPTTHTVANIGCYNDADATNPNGACGSFQLVADSGRVQDVTLENADVSNDGWGKWWSMPTLTTSVQFGPPMVVGTTGTLTISYSAAGGLGSVDFSGVDTTALLPSGVTIANGNVTKNNCGSATALAAPSATCVDVAGMSVAKGQTCSITYNVTSSQLGDHTMNSAIVKGNIGNIVADGKDATLQVIDKVTASNDTAVTSVGTPVTTDVRSNDSAASGNALVNPTVISVPAHGSAVVNADGTITYTPAAGFSGVDTYDYGVCTGAATAVCDVATVTITVNNVFTPGPASATGVTTEENKQVITPITDIVTPIGKPVDPTKVTQVTPPARGKIVIDPTTGEITYTPNPGTSGPDEYTIDVCDTSSPAQCSPFTVKVTVAPNVLTAPNKSVTTKTGTSVTLNVVSGVHSKSGQKLAKPTVSKPKHGIAKVNPNGTITYTPAKGFSGTDTFKYTVCDTGTPKACVTRSITVNVKGTVVVPSLPDTGGPSLALLLGGGAALLGGLALMRRSRMA